MKIAQVDAEPGEYWLVTKDGEDPWPVVICDEDIVRSYFKEKKRPEGARRRDGTWGEEFRIRGKRFGKRYFPALKLGIMKLCWAPRNHLQPIDIQMAVTSGIRTTNRELSTAFLEAVEQYDRKDLIYWKNKLFAEQLDKEQNPEQIPWEKRKAKASADSGYCRQLKERWLNNAKDDDDDLFMSSDEPLVKRIKNEFSSTMSEAENNALYEDSEPKHPSSTPFTMIRAKSVLVRPSSARSMTPLGVRSSSIVNDPNMVTLYVGNPHQLFKAPLTSIKTSPFLVKHLSHSAADGSYIMAPALSQLIALNFDPVCEFLHRGEYRPDLLDADTPFARLENTGTRTEVSNEQEVYRCGIIYCIASKLELPSLRNLTVKKLKVLEPYFPDFKSEFLGVVGLVYGHGGAGEDKDFDEWMVRRLAEWFGDLMRGTTLEFLEILEDYPELAKRVFGVLAGNPVVQCGAGEGYKDFQGQKMVAGDGNEENKDEKWVGSEVVKGREVGKLGLDDFWETDICSQI